MRLEPLSAHHRLDQFSSGNKTLDNWLARFAWANQERDISRTYVLADDSNGVAGYYSLTMGSVQEGELPQALREDYPKYALGMVLLARLAVDIAHQRHGLGRDLLIDAIKRAALAGTEVAARFIAVDPIDANARAFYAHFGFRDIGGDPAERMYLTMQEALTSLF